MTRELKCRAWLKAKKKMLNVCELYLRYEPQVAVLKGDHTEPWIKTTLDEIELLWATGLQDKHDNEIYEGNIVRLSNGTLESIEDIHAFCGECGINGDNPKDVEIIGNIYENSELLERPRE